MRSKAPSKGHPRTATAIQPLIKAVLLCMLATSSAMGVDSPKATMIGGADASGRNYSWTVTNDHSSPIVFVEFPFDKVLLFLAPQGWQTDCGRQTGAAFEHSAKTCAARTPSPASGIARGTTEDFEMRLFRSGARRGPGTVLVRFADGSEVRVGGVELPQRKGLGDRYVALFALGAAFAVWGVVRAVRRPRTTAKTPTDEPSTRHDSDS